MTHYHQPAPAPETHKRPIDRPSRRHGRQARGFDPRIPHASAIRLRRKVAAARPIPASINYLSTMPQPISLGAMLNDKLGDCSCAGLYHFLQVLIWRASGLQFWPSDDLVLQLYVEACGYKPGDPSTDRGGILQDVLAYCMRTGIPMPDGSRNTLLGYVELDPRQPEDIQRAIAEGGAIYIGIEIPEAYTEAEEESIWDVTDSPIEGGHCVIAAGYDDQYLYIVSWGGMFRMTWAAFAKYCDEAYLPLDRVWIQANDNTPFGMSEEEYESLMAPLKAA